MTRTAFLAALEQLLAPLPESERKDALVQSHAAENRQRG